MWAVSEEKWTAGRKAYQYKDTFQDELNRKIKVKPNGDADCDEDDDADINRHHENLSSPAGVLRSSANCIGGEQKVSARPTLPREVKAAGMPYRCAQGRKVLKCFSARQMPNQCSWIS